MNEINKLIWPAESGVGVIDTAAWDRTVEHRQRDHEPRRRHGAHQGARRQAWTNDIVNEAIAQLTADGVDVTGSSFAPIEVELTEGGA